MNSHSMTYGSYDQQVLKTIMTMCCNQQHHQEQGIIRDVKEQFSVFLEEVPVVDLELIYYY